MANLEGNTILRHKNSSANKAIGRIGSSINSDLKNGIWLYFFLLIFEGALRKWGFPALSTPLLIIRDPIVLWLLIKANQRGLFLTNGYTILMQVIALVGFFTAILLGHGSLSVAVFGIRIGLLYFPFMFVIGKVFDRDDVLKVGKWTIMLGIPIALLLAMQFYSPQTAWVNRGLAGNENGSGFSGANGYFRPSGTFSFTSGNTLFYGLVASFVLYFWLNIKEIDRWLLFAGTAALLIAIPLSISRTLISEVGISVAFLLIFTLQKPKYLGRVFGALILIGIGFFILSNFSFFSTATDALTTRFDQASTAEKGSATDAFLNRFFGGLFSAVSQSDKLPFFGLGLGMGTNAGAALLTGGSSNGYLIAEAEWGRVIGEQGLFLGLTIIIIRLIFALKLTSNSFRRMIKEDILAWMLLSFGFILLIQAQMGQPTALGFSTLIGGLILASLNTIRYN